MLALGPTFIKVGQVLSTRPDVVPPVYAEELATLQDAVPAGPYREMIPTIAEDVGYHEYDEFDPEPIAGGSLAQVYDATYEETRAAVKVRRPGIRDLIETDLRVIRRLLPIVVTFAPERFHFSLRNLADDFERVILEELDFDREARMMDEIRGNFADDPTVIIPTVYPEASSERVLTMEYVEGIKITDVEGLEAAGFDPTSVASDVANAYFTMGLVHGVFHGDPHPGNLAVDADGRVVFYDFGMSGRFTPAMQDAIIKLYLAVVDRDVETIMDVLIEMDALESNVDRTRMAAMLHLMIDEFEGRSGVDWRVILSDVIEELRAFPFRLPPDVMLVLRVGTVSEGVLRELDPEFDFIAAAREFLVRHGFMERGARMLFEDLQADVERSIRATIRLPYKLEQALDELAREDARWERVNESQRRAALARRQMIYAILASSLIVGGSILTTVDLRYGLIGFVVALFVVVFLLWGRSRGGL